MRRAAKVDANHSQIVSALEAIGCSVLSLAAVGKGCPDILVAKGSTCMLIEIKDGRRPPSERRLTPDQQKFHSEWRGPLAIVMDVEAAIRAVQSTGA